MSDDDLILPRRRGRWLVALAACSLVASFALLLWPGDDSRRDSVDADGYSLSAIGHAGWLQLLRDVGVPVIQSRQVREQAIAGLLVVAEPDELDEDELASLDAAMQQAESALLVLPKRAGDRDMLRQHWLGADDLVPLARANDTLGGFLGRRSQRAPEVQRHDTVTGWRTSGLRDVDLQVLGAPEPLAPVQLLDAGSTRLEPLVACDQGILLARIGDLFVLSDPDLIANHGLANGANAALAVAMVRHAKGAGAVVVDETCHGHAVERSIWTELGRFPLVLVAVQWLLLLGLALWIAAERFGAPLPAPPALEAGKAVLIDNVVALLDRRGRHGPVVRRYVRQRVRRAAEWLHVPPGSNDAACREWLLGRLPDPEQARELGELLDQNLDQLTEPGALALAQRVFELTDQPGGSRPPGSRPSASRPPFRQPTAQKP